MNTNINFLKDTNQLVLTEGAVVERIRRTDPELLDLELAHARALYSRRGRSLLEGIHRQYLGIGRLYDLTLLVFTDTWRASKARMEAAGMAECDVNGDCARFLRTIVQGYGAYAGKVALAGLIGCKGDAYRPEEALSDHITKHIDPAQLFRTLARWINTGEEAQKSAEVSPAPTDQHTKEPLLPEQTLPDELPGFDLSDGLQRLMGNRTLYQKLLINFAMQYKQAAVQIRSALDAGDFMQAHGMIHAIKGVAGNLAAKDLQTQSVVLEKLVKHADPASPPPTAELNQAYEAFRGSLGRALNAVGSLMPSAVTPETPEMVGAGSLPIALAKEAATRLREAAELGDVSALADICGDLTAQSDAFAPYATRVARLADDFDFDGVVKLTEELTK